MRSESMTPDATEDLQDLAGRSTGWDHDKIRSKLRRETKIRQETYELRERALDTPHPDDEYQHVEHNVETAIGDKESDRADQNRHSDRRGEKIVSICRGW